MFGRWSGSCSMLAVNVVAWCSAVSHVSEQTQVCDTWQHDRSLSNPGDVAEWRLSHTCVSHGAALLCSQVKAVLATILSSVQQQVAGSTHSSSSSLPAGYDPVLAARWAAANPPGSCGCGSSSSGNNSNISSSSEQQAAGDAAPDGTQQAPGPAVAGAAAAHDAAGAPHDAPARDNTLCVHFYSPTTHALLSHVYSQAHALLQPTPPAPVDPPKKGEGLCCPSHDTLPACTCSQLA